jgi:hypothetical protein
MPLPSIMSTGLTSLDSNVARAITSYELHLRYLVHAMRWAGHPFAYQTVGSSMAVRRKAYLSLGGMNTRQAGEDFYFLQKFIEVGSLHARYGALRSGLLPEYRAGYLSELEGQ